MNSPYNGKPMRLQFHKEHITFKGQRIRYTHISYLCQESGESFTSTTLNELNLYQLYQQYAIEHNIPIEQVIPKEPDGK